MIRRGWLRPYLDARSKSEQFEYVHAGRLTSISVGAVRSGLADGIRRSTRGALVTGAASGIGRSAARALARRGYDVAINYRRSEGPAREVAAEAAKLGAAVARR